MWREQVADAVLSGDGGDLRALFAVALDLFGAAAGERWAEVLSAYDASAITG